MLKVYTKPGERIEKTLKRFKRICEKEGIVKDLRRHEYYESKSQRRRRARLLSAKRRDKERLEQANPRFQKRKPDDGYDGPQERSYH